MENKLVSIIVPVYGVEKELPRCLDSLLDQTYKNIEILLVDDGSPDQCPQICDFYGEKDQRVRVFHKKNGGLSAARNYALERVTGEYISFVDGDDWVEKDFIEILVHDLEVHHADISIIGYALAWENGKCLNQTSENVYEVLDREQAIRELFIQQKFQCMSCTKLYKKSLFDSVRFPEGKLFEDIAVSLDLFRQCSSVVVNGTSKYMYYQRANSIVNSKMNEDKLVMLEFVGKMVEYAKTQGGMYIIEAEAFYLKSALMLILQAYNSPQDGEVIRLTNILKEEIKKHKKYIFRNPYIEKRRRIVLRAILIGVSPKLINKLWKVKVSQ